MDTQQVIDLVTQRVKDTANVEAVFGKPIESKGVTMIPVASVKVAGGGGGGVGRPKGGEASKPDKGMGLGMRVTATPVGYIEVIDGKARMVDIIDKNKMALGGLVAGGLVLMTIMKAAAWRMKHSSE